MEHQTRQVGSFEVNCTVLSENGRAWIVDPGQEADRLVALLKDQRLSPVAILLTHAHFDHIGAIPGLQREFPDLPVYVGTNDLKVLSHPLNQLPPDYPPVGNVCALKETRELKLPGLQIIDTPGHTPGGVCYHFPQDKLLLSGDTLFAGSVGRTDLPGGDMATLMNSIEKLKLLPDDTTVIPGHGMFTTIAAEKRGNPFWQ